ncbi:MAG: T9SS type A sorting domain-containing protein [Flavobacteriales bacterium]|nr:T9SS type A sorting domain-containing protein [Flavobacteriales bacterium]
MLVLPWLAYAQCSNFTITVGGGSFDSEISWYIQNGSGTTVASGGAPGVWVYCLNPDCFTIVMNDSFGDGWNGASMVITDSGGAVVWSGSGTGSSSSATAALNGGSCGGGPCSFTQYTLSVGGGSFDSEVSWVISGDAGTVLSGFAPTYTTLCAEDGCYTVDMFDSFGDGWNGAQWVISDMGGNVIGSGSLGAGSSGQAFIQLGNASCDFPEPVTASDCHDAINVCTNIDFYIDPNGYGDVYEIPAPGSTSNPSYDGFTNFNPWGTTNTGCLLSQELNSTWMLVNISQGGWLEFTFGGLGTQSGYYDWAMWTFDENTCNNILNDLQAPVRCNWNGVSTGGTGLAGTIPAGGNASNYEPPLWTLTGDQYLICFSNWSSVSTNVPLEFGGTAIVSCEPIMLPVEVVEFQAQCAGSMIAVEWATLSEQDNAYFVVQRSSDSQVWNDVAYAEGAGDSFEVKRYAFADKMVPRTVLYYRLKQVDFDGNIRFTEPVSVNCALDPEILIMPNPVDGGEAVFVKLINPWNGMTCTLVNMQGLEIVLDVNEEIDTRSLDSGVYLIRLMDSNGEGLACEKLVVR